MRGKIWKNELARGRVVCNRVVRPSGRHRDACPERGLQRRASDSDSEISVWSVDSEGARDLASRPGGRPPRLRPSSASGAGAGDGARGGGGHTGANGIGDRIGDLGGVGVGENGGDWAGYDADSDRAGGGGPSAPASIPKVPGTTSRGSSSDGAGAAAS